MIAPALVGAAPPPVRPRRRASAAVQVISTAITILAVVLLGFAAYIGVVARLHHDRAQLVAYANFRTTLALGTAPTGQTKPTDARSVLDLGTPVALLTIPKLHLNEVVFEGTTGAVLENGPGHLRETPLPGQAGVSEIMGRAAMYGGPFGHLAELLPDDTFTVTTGQGVHTYRVLDVRRSGLPKPPLPAPGTGRLVLVTAYGGPVVPYDQLSVDADLTSPVQQSSRLSFGVPQTPDGEKAMALDDGAWYPLVFLGELLVLSVGLVSWLRVAWGSWQTWIVALPTVGFFGLAVADQAARLLPNLM